MKARYLEFVQPRQAAVTEANVPALSSTELLVEVEVSLVSVGTERSFLMQAPHYPFRPGYSVVGRVVALGEAVRGFALGDRVFACAHHGSDVVCDFRFAFKVPEGVSSEAAVFASVGAMAVCATRLAGIGWGDPVLVMGQGLIGLLTTQMARQQGGMPVMATDIQQRRLSLAERLGADRVFDARDERALSDAVSGLPGRGVAAVIEFCAGADVMDQSIDLCRRRGRIVAGSLGHQVKPTNVYGQAWLKALQILPVYVNARPWQLQQVDVTSPLDWPIKPYDAGEYDGNETDTTSGDYALFLKMLQHRRVEVEPLIEERMTPAEAAGFFNGASHPDALGVLIHWH